MAEKRIPAVHGFESIDLDGKKGVLIDLDNTLYPYNENHARGLAACLSLAKCSYEVTDEQFEESYKLGRSQVHLLLKYRASSHSRLLYFQRASEHLFGKTDINYALKMEACYWSAFLEGMVLFPEAKEFLVRCKKVGLKTCIVTDLTAQIQMQKWNRLKFDGLIDYLVTSEEAGIEKPAAEIFEMALAKLELSNDEVLMIGDNYNKDIVGAEQSGIKAYHLRPDE